MTCLSLLHDSAAGYPEDTDGFSPSERFPEYAYKALALAPNAIYRMVRDVFRQYDLDAEQAESPKWNPLGDMVPRGSRVVILCNFVHHRRAGESLNAFRAKCIHGALLRALIDYTLIAVGPEGRVIFGNAPLQSCVWQNVLNDTCASSVLAFYERQGIINVEARDLRLYQAHEDIFGRVTHVDNNKDSDLAISIDLGCHSLLEELGDTHQGRFRVSDYNPDDTEQYHGHGRHVYVINRTVLDADVIISLPKLKTHEKVGITCGLKGFVGAVARKECLAHHRFGGPDQHGDEYPSRSSVRVLLSRFHDYVNTQEPGYRTRDIMGMVDRNTRRIIGRLGYIQAGAWYGNDTAWRMALDIARILIYGRTDGAMADRPQRRHLLLVDGVVGGEGNGPLRPNPVRSGLLLFSDDVALGDWVCALLMGFDPKKIPLIREAFVSRPYPVSQICPDAQSVVMNGQRIAMNGQISLQIRSFAPPNGWRGHIEQEAL